MSCKSLISFLLELLDVVINGNLTETRRLLSTDVKSAYARYNNNSYTLLQKATIYGCSKIVKKLLKCNADVNAQGITDWIALHHTSSLDSRIPIMIDLLNHHADVNLKHF